MTEKVDVGNSWSGVWIPKNDNRWRNFDGATTHNIFTTTNEKKEASNDAGNESRGAASELVKGKMIVVGDDKKVTIWDRGGEDNETKGLSMKLFLTWICCLVQIVREEK